MNAQQQMMVAYVRAGGFRHVAAAASGVSRLEFGSVRAAVRQAGGEARLTAEMKVHKDKPLDWLKSGPGRDTGGAPGWTAAARAGQRRERGGMDLFRHREFQMVFATVLEVLAPFPEARAAIVAVLQKE